MCERRAAPNPSAWRVMRARSSLETPRSTAAAPWTGRGDDDEVAQPLEQVVDEPARILPGLHDAVDGRERRRGVLGREGVDDLVEQLGVRVAEQRHRALVAHEDLRRSQPASEPAISWSSSDSVSRGDPPPPRTTSGSTPASTETPSVSQSCSTYSSIAAGGTSRNG